jgi:drug/metabolite transporter (DMT)-like permease
MTSQTTLPARAWGELTLLSLIWGGVFLSVRITLDEIGFLTSVAHRVIWASLVLWAVVLVMRLPVPLSPRVWGAFLVMGVLNNALPFCLLAWGQLYIESGLTAIFNASTAIFTVLVAALVFADEPLGLRRAAGVLLGFGGVATAIGLDTLAQLDPRSLAQLAVLGATFSYALASVWAKKRLSGIVPQVAVNAEVKFPRSAEVIFPTFGIW